MVKKKDETETTGDEGEGSEGSETTTEPKVIRVEHIFKDERGQQPPAESDEEETTDTEGEGAGGEEEGGEKKPKKKTEEPPATVPPKTGGEPPAEGEGAGESKDDKELEETKKKLQEREAQLAALALKDFNDKKAALLDKVKDEKKRKYVEDFIGDDPAKFKQVELMTGLLTNALGGGEGEEGDEEEGEGDENDGAETPPPKGKVKKQPKKPTADLSGRQIIDDLYNILADPTKTKTEKDIADKKITELFGQFTKGSKDAGKIVKIKVLNCPQCGNTMEGNTCQHCGYTMPKWEQSPPSLR